MEQINIKTENERFGDFLKKNWLNNISRKKLNKIKKEKQKKFQKKPKPKDNQKRKRKGS